MLNDYPVHPTIPVKDIERAKKFYTEKLELKVQQDTPAGTMLEVKNGRLLIYPTPSAGTSQHTLMGWTVDDIGAVVKHLKDNGVVFEEYDNEYIKTIDSVAKNPAGHSAWFKDSEGNILGLFQPDQP